MLATSEKWKQTIERDDRQCRGYITLSDTIISDELFDYKIKDTIYDDDFIGSFVKKRCDVNILNKERVYDFDNQKIKVYAGLQYEDDTDEYLFMGTYIVSTAKYDDVNYQSSLECYDLSMLFDITYVKQSEFPCTIKKYLEDICKAVGVTLSTKAFNMQDVVLTEEPYLDAGSTYRDAVRQIAKICIACAQIINDELVITSLKRIDTTPDFTLGDYFELTTEKAIGPYNVLTLSRVPQEDNYPFPQPLPENPIEYRIENNPIVDKQRELYAPIIYQFLNGLTFIPCSVTLLKGRPEITALDYFAFNDMQEVRRQSIVFTHEFTFDGNFSSIISCTSKSQTQTDYKRAGTITKRVQTTELWVDKAKGEIESLVKDMYEEDGIVTGGFSQIHQELDSITTTVNDTTKKVEEIEKVVELFVPTLEPDLVLVPTYENGLPKTSTEYFVEYSAKLEGNDVTPTVTCQSENEGITLAITEKLTFTVNSNVAIPNKDNKYELVFTYKDGETTYTKTMILYLMRVNENEDLSERLEQIEKDLNNNYPNNDELNEALEGQKATIIEETSTMISQSASEVTTSIINKVNTDGVTTLKNTLVTIDINGINVAKNDEDVVSLLDNKGLYVSDGKLKEDESNLLMKTDRNGAYFKSATIDGTIKEQGLFQKEVIDDPDFGKSQAGYYIGG